MPGCYFQNVHEMAVNNLSCTLILVSIFTQNDGREKTYNDKFWGVIF